MTDALLTLARDLCGRGMLPGIRVSYDKLITSTPGLRDAFAYEADIAWSAKLYCDSRGWSIVIDSWLRRTVIYRKNESPRHVESDWIGCVEGTTAESILRAVLAAAEAEGKSNA